jgi:hypothetical protein
MGKKIFLLAIMAFFLGMVVTPVFSNEECSKWSRPHSGVLYRYCKVTADTYDVVQFYNQNTCKVRIEYTTVQYPYTKSTLFLESGETSQKAAIVPGDSLKTIDVNCVE